MPVTIVTKKINLNTSYLCNSLALYFITCLLVNYTCYASESIKTFKPEYIKSLNLDSFLEPAFINKNWVAKQAPYNACSGYYAKPSILNVSIPEISADSFEVRKNGISLLSGDVTYLDGIQKVSGHKALIKRDDAANKVTEIYAAGNIEYLNNELRLVTTDIFIDTNKNTTFVNHPAYFTYYPNHARGEASSAILTKDKNYKVNNSLYTSCPPNNNDWVITAEEINIDPNKQVGTAKNTTLYFYGMPVLYTPYLRFPTSNQRESGLLMPIYNSSSRFGYSLTQPVYLNLAPNYDLTFYPRFMTKRGAQLGVEARHLNKYGNHSTTLEYIAHDKELNNFKQNKLTVLPASLSSQDPRVRDLARADTRRYSLKILDQRQFGPYVTTSIDYNRLSDGQYFVDLPSTNVLRGQTEGHLLQEAQANFNYHNWRGQVLAKGYQTIHTIDGPDLTEPYRILPSVNLKNNNLILLTNKETNLSGPLVFAFDSHATRFASPRNPKPNKTAEGQRYYVKPALSVPVYKTYGFFIPKVAANIRYYDLNRLSVIDQSYNIDKNQNYFIPIFSIDSGLYLDKIVNVNNNLIMHTIEPRLYYLNVPKVKQYEAPDFDIKTNTISFEQLYRDNDYSGFDRQSNANQITTGLISKVQNAHNGKEYAKLQLGQTFYFQNKNITICNQEIDLLCLNNELPNRNNRYSPFISQLNINLDQVFHIDSTLYGQAEWQWDYYLNTTNRINAGLHYLNQNLSKSTPQTIFNIEYNFIKNGNIQKDVNGNKKEYLPSKRHDLSVLETSFKLPLHKNLIGLGFYSYDIRNHDTLDGYFGLELQNCCWAARFGYRSQLRLRANSEASKKYDSIFTVQFSLKGLGELNQSFENVLKTNITGYKNQLDKIY